MLSLSYKIKPFYWILYNIFIYYYSSSEIRGFGLETRFEQTPSNESFFPSTLYGALGYNADSLRDVFFQVSILYLKKIFEFYIQLFYTRT